MNSSTFAPPARRQGFLGPIRMSQPAPQSSDRLHGQAPFMGTVQMGQSQPSAEDWYFRAKTALERYNFLKGRIAAIDNERGRNAVTMWLTAGGNNSPAYRYNAVRDDFTTDAAPENDGVNAYSYDNPSGRRRRSRIEKLEEFNVQFAAAIQDAFAAHGEREVANGNGNGKDDKGPDLTLPIIGAAAVIGLALIFG